MIGSQGITTVTGLHGVLRGYLDVELSIWDPIPGARIVAAPVDESTAFPRRTGGGASRRSVVQVTAEEVAAAASAAGAIEGKTDDQGRFALASRPVQGSWRLFACFSAIRAAGASASAPLRREVCFDMGVYHAQGLIDAIVPHKLYCTLKGMADQWTVFGRVTECSSGASISGAVGKAFDTDWLQHDALGSGVSSGSGV